VTELLQEGPSYIVGRLPINSPRGWSSGKASKADVLGNREFWQACGLLMNHSDSRRNAVSFGAELYELTAQFDVTFIWPNCTTDDPNQSALASSVLADEGVNQSRPNL
jgi:hypothetical protein